MQRETAERGAAARAVEVASAAGSGVRSGVVAAKDTVVAGATRVASVGTETARTVAQACLHGAPLFEAEYGHEHEAISLTPRRRSRTLYFSVPRTRAARPGRSRAG